MRKLIIIFFALSIISEVKAQLAIEYSAGYGTYSMSDMNSLLSNIKDEVNASMPNIDARIVTSFPDYIIHNLSIGYQLKKMEFGINNSYYTTGSKISRQDYSGEYSLKMYVNALRQGLYYRNYFYTADINGVQKLHIYAEISPSIIFTKVKIKEKLRVYENETVMNDETVNNISFSFLPQIGSQFNFNRQIGVFAKIGYDITIPGNTEILEHKTKIDWSGFRASAGLRFSL